MTRKPSASACGGSKDRFGPTQVAPAHFSWDYTTYLNIVFLVLFAVLYWAYRNRASLGGTTATPSTWYAGCKSRWQTHLRPRCRRASRSTSVLIVVGCASRRIRSDSPQRQASPGGPSNRCLFLCPSAARPGNKTERTTRRGAGPHGRYLPGPRSVKSWQEFSR